MFAPVFLWELRHAFRQRWFHNVRRAYAVIVLFFFLWHLQSLYSHPSYWLRMFRTVLWVTQEYAGYITAIHLVAVLVLTPALAVAAVVQAKNLRIFELLLSTHQSATQIVAGHWLAAIAKLMIITAPGWPLVLWMHSMLGTPWWTITAYLGCLSLLALPIAAWSVLVAVWMRRGPAAFVAGYFGSVVMWPLLFAFFSDAQLSMWSHAIYDARFWCKVAFLASAPTLTCLTLAIVMLRRCCFAQAVAATTPAARPVLGEAPIYWKQYFLVDWVMWRPLRRLPHWARLLAFAVLAVAVSSLDPGMADLTPHCETVLILVGFPLVALVWAASAINLERETGTWDPLRITLLRADEYVTQTLEAIESRVRAYWLATLPAALLLSCKRWNMAGVPFVAWLIAGVAIHHAAVLGLHASVTVRSTSGSVMKALMSLALRVVAFGLGGFFVAGAGVFLLVPVIGVVALLTNAPAELLLLCLAPVLMLAFMYWIFWRTSRYHVIDAIQRLAQEDRFEAF